MARLLLFDDMLWIMQSLRVGVETLCGFPALCA